MSPKTETGAGNRASAGNRTVSGSVSELTRENGERKPETKGHVSASGAWVLSLGGCAGSRFLVSGQGQR